MANVSQAATAVAAQARAAKPPIRLFRNMHGEDRHGPDDGDGDLRLHWLHRLDDLLFADDVAGSAGCGSARSGLGGLSQYSRLFHDRRWQISVHNLALFGTLHADLRLRGGLPARRVHGPEDPLREHVPHDLPLSLRAVVHHYRPRLGVDAQSRLRPAEIDPRPRLGELQLRLDRQSENGGLHAGHCRRLAGNRPGDGADARRAPRHRRGDLESLACRRHSEMADLHLDRHPDDAPGVRDGARHRRSGNRQDLRSGGRHDRWRTRPLVAIPDALHLRVHVRFEPVAGPRSVHRSSGYGRHHRGAVGLLRVRPEAQRQ